MKANFINQLFSKKTISTIMACITYFSICISQVIETYNPVSWIILFALIILFNKVDIHNKKNKKEIIFLSILFSVLLVYGRAVSSIMYSSEANVFGVFFSTESFINIIGLFNLLFIVLTCIYPKISSLKILNPKSKIKNKTYIFLISFLIIFICWIPYFLSYYPGILSPDSISEISIIIKNLAISSDHHPVLHILFIAFPFYLGKAIFGTVTAGVALSTLLQMIVMAIIFSSFIVFLHNRKVSEHIVLIVLLYYALLSMHGYYSITMWKDVIFAGGLLLLTMEIVKLIEKYNSNNINIKSLVPFILVSILCIFFRNNAIYMYFLLAIFTIIILKKYYKPILISFLIIFGTYFIVKGPIFNYLNIQKSASAEYIAIPLQQVGRMAFKNIEFNKKEKNLINEIIPIEIMAKVYNPVTSDGIKFNKEYKDMLFDAKKSDYFKLWLSLIIKHPDVALESYSISTLGYWYPGLQYWSVSTEIEDNNLDLYMKPKLPESVEVILSSIESRGLPILNIQWSIAFCFWTIFVFGMISFKKNKWIGLYPYIPIIGIWLTMMIASPVYGEFRYVYGAFTCLPLLILYPYFKLKNNYK